MMEPEYLRKAREFVAARRHMQASDQPSEDQQVRQEDVAQKAQKAQKVSDGSMPSGKSAGKPSRYARTKDELTPRITPEKVVFVQQQLDPRGPCWARRYMEEVEGFAKWPRHIQKAVIKAEQIEGQQALGPE